MMFLLEPVAVESSVESISLPTATAKTRMSLSSRDLTVSLTWLREMPDLTSVIITNTFLTFGRADENSSSPSCSALAKSGVPPGLRIP